MKIDPYLVAAEELNVRGCLRCGRLPSDEIVDVGKQVTWRCPNETCGKAHDVLGDGLVRRNGTIGRPDPRLREVCATFLSSVYLNGMQELALRTTRSATLFRLGKMRVLCMTAMPLDRLAVGDDDAFVVLSKHREDASTHLFIVLEQYGRLGDIRERVRTIVAHWNERRLHRTRLLNAEAEPAFT